jgi:hypothetical protein
MHAQREHQYLFCLFDSIGMTVFAPFLVELAGFAAAAGVRTPENAIKINCYRRRGSLEDFKDLGANRPARQLLNCQYPANRTKGSRIAD